jgi:hypothetical protein
MWLRESNFSLSGSDLDLLSLLFILFWLIPRYAPTHAWEETHHQRTITRSHRMRRIC